MATVKKAAPKAAEEKAPVKVKAPVKAAKAAPKAAPKTAPKADATPAQPVKVDLKGLAARVHEQLPLVSGPVVAKVVEATFAAMAEAYAKGDIVNIKDFGKLFIVDRPARTGRNPATGQPVEIAAKRVPKFTFAKALKDMV